MDSITKNSNETKKKSRETDWLGDYIAIYSGATVMGFLYVLLAKYFDVTLSPFMFFVMAIVTLIPSLVAVILDKRFQCFISGFWALNVSATMAMSLRGENVSAVDQTFVSIITLCIVGGLWLYRNWTDSFKPDDDSHWVESE
ncbi:hypothetical protein KBC70_04530 [Candidatus Woesebacteria bacterium]|nr:hypothetical protein [Candidatus Woesebacteria bacterium]